MPATTGPAWITRPACRPLAWALLQALLVGLVLGSLLWNAVALLLLPLVKPVPLIGRDRATALGRRVISRGYAAFWRLARASGLLEMDAVALDVVAHEPGLVIVANHPSMLDALMLVARLPRAFCVMKASILRNPLFGAGAMLARYIPNRTSYEIVRGAVDELQRGGQFVIFPEATRTTALPVNPFNTTVGLIAKLAGSPVQAVFIDTDSPYLGKGWPAWRLPPLPVRFKVRLGQRFAPPDDPQALHAELEAYFAAGVWRAGR